MKQTQIYIKEITINNLLKSLDKIKFNLKFTENKIHNILTKYGYYKLLQNDNELDKIIKLKMNVTNCQEKKIIYNDSEYSLFTQEIETIKTDTVRSHIPYEHKYIILREFCFPLNGNETKLILEYYNDTLRDFYVLTKKDIVVDKLSINEDIGLFLSLII